MEPELESVLFRSPYSGCGQFSGWPKETSAGPIPWTPAQNAYKPPGALLCVDRYHKVIKSLKTPQTPRQGPPRAVVTIATAPQAGRFTIRGPSATGPWTYRDTQGTYPVFRPGSVGTGQSLGLT